MITNKFISKVNQSSQLSTKNYYLSKRYEKSPGKAYKKEVMDIVFFHNDKYLISFINVRYNGIYIP